MFWKMNLIKWTNYICLDPEWLNERTYFEWNPVNYTKLRE